MHFLGLLGMPRRVYTYDPAMGWDIYNLIATVGAFIIALSVLVFIINFFWMLTRGPRAGGNPWDGDSLEWSTPSPPVPHGYTRLPVVRSRHPMWDQENLTEGSPETVKLVEALARWPLKWRAAVVTTTLDARPQEVFRVANPSIWPFIAAVGMTTILADEVFSVHMAGGVGLRSSWARWRLALAPPGRSTRPRRSASSARPGCPCGRRSPIISRWPRLAACCVSGIVVGTLLFAYFYCGWRIRTGRRRHPLFSAALAGVLRRAAAGRGRSARWSERSVQRDQQGRLRLALALTFLFIAGPLAVQAADLFNSPPLGYARYGSIFYASRWPCFSACWWRWCSTRSRRSVPGGGELHSATPTAVGNARAVPVRDRG